MGTQRPASQKGSLIRRIMVLLGAVLVSLAVALALTTGVGFDGHQETIGGRSDTNAVVAPMALLIAGSLLLAAGLP